MFQLLKSVEAFVEYREKGNDRIFSVSAKGAALKGNNGITDSYIYTAELTDLKKGTALSIVHVPEILSAAGWISGLMTAALLRR